MIIVLFHLFSFPISLEWGGKTVSETVYWFQYERDLSLNSNVYDVATKLVQRHFPGEFGSERLVQKVVDIILRQTAKREGENKGLLQCDVFAFIPLPSKELANHSIHETKDHN